MPARSLKLFLLPEEAQEVAQLETFSYVLKQPVRVILPDGRQLTFYYTGDLSKLEDILQRLFANADTVLTMSERRAIKVTADKLLEAALVAFESRRPDIFFSLLDHADEKEYVRVHVRGWARFREPSSKHRRSLHLRFYKTQIPVDRIREAVDLELMTSSRYRKAWLALRSPRGYVITKNDLPDLELLIVSSKHIPEDRLEKTRDGSLACMFNYSTRYNFTTYSSVEVTGKAPSKLMAAVKDTKTIFNVEADLVVFPKALVMLARIRPKSKT